MPDGFPSELMLVLEGDLYLIPFPVLKGTNCTDFLCERFSLMVTPSLTSMKTRYPKPRLNGILEEDSKALVVANPRIPTSVTEHWGWADIPKVGFQEFQSVRLNHACCAGRGGGEHSG